MLDIRRVLFPTDQSETSEQAFVHAAHLAATHDADLHVVHVTPEPSGTSPDLVPRALSEVPAELGIAASGQFGVLDETRITQREVRSDSAANGILDYAKRNDVDMIVMGTHGRKGIEQLLIGSVAEEVVRKAECPVLTVRSAGSLEVRRILVPIDFSDRSKAVIPIARALADLYGAEVELFSVIDEDDLPASGAPILGPGHVAPDEVEKRFRKLMTDLVAENQNGIPVRGTVRTGRPSEEILDRAAEECDLIVMATHGRTGMKRLLLGSIAEKVIRQSPCPVFTVRSFGRSLVAAA